MTKTKRRLERDRIFCTRQFPTKEEVKMVLSDQFVDSSGKPYVLGYEFTASSCGNSNYTQSR